MWGYFLGPPRSTDKTTLIIKVSKGAKIRNGYNQVPHLIQDTYGICSNMVAIVCQKAQPLPLHLATLNQGLVTALLQGNFN